MPTQAIALCLGLFAALYGCLEAGLSLGRRHRAANADVAPTGTIDAAIFGLLGLLLSFTFSGAAQRFDARRDLIVSEANAVGTAYLRVDLMPEKSQPAMRDLFAKYVDSRVAAYKEAADPVLFREGLAKSEAVQQQIWKLAIESGRSPDALPAMNMLLLPALNEMIDITATRTFARVMHPPSIIYGMLVGLALVSALLAGDGMSTSPRRNVLHMVSFAAIMTAAIYVTIDMEHPRLGTIRVDAFEDLVIEKSLGK